MCRKYTPDFLKLADAYGVAGYRVKNETDMKEVFKIVFKEKKDEPALVEVWVPKEENVMPMVPPGGSLSDVIAHDQKSNYGM